MNINFNSNMMTGFKTRRQKFGVGSLIFLLLFGAMFTGAGVVALKSTKIDPSWSRVSGQVTDSSSSISNGSTIYAAVVQYKVNGQAYQVTSSTSSSSYPHIGDSRQVAYNPSQPNEAKVVEGAGSTWWLYLFPAVGIACLVIAPYTFIKSLRRSGDINHLIQVGQKLQGVLTDVQSMGGNNNNNSYKIVVSATDNTGTVQSYVSDVLGGIGGLAMADFRNNPVPIDVYVNPANPKDYYVDVSDIPNLTPERIAELIKSATHSQSNTFADGEKPPTPTQS
ncbi:MAG: hypothetical protein JWL89_473 [Candidatus Saccharibacteria bacterium]|jgi:hypothetical protein|nr:hypothetical protein [Candidatus Saccharibacteria bacterium]